MKKKKLKTWSVMIPYHASVIVRVEAATEQEAREIACEEAFPHLCHQCSDDVEIGEPNDDADIEVIELAETDQDAGETAK